MRAPFAADGHVRAVRDQLPERLDGEEAVPPDLLAADDALEQAGVSAPVEQMKRRHRRQRIAQHPAIDRHELVTSGQRAKRLKIRQMRHGATVAWARRARTRANRNGGCAAAIAPAARRSPKNLEQLLAEQVHQRVQYKEGDSEHRAAIARRWAGPASSGQPTPGGAIGNPRGAKQ